MFRLLNQFFALAPLYHESLKATDVPGAIRAQSSHYWVWGWDSMTSGDACFYWGDLTFIEQMLDCFMQYADESGIAHAFDRDMRCEGSAPAPAQGMYLTLLDRYRMAGGNVSPYYPFAVRLFDRIVETEVDRTGLCSGTSLYPDFRELIGENGRDISTSWRKTPSASSEPWICGRATPYPYTTKAPVICSGLLHRFGKPVPVRA